VEVATIGTAATFLGRRIPVMLLLLLLRRLLLSLPFCVGGVFR